MVHVFAMSMSYDSITLSFFQAVYQGGRLPLELNHSDERRNFG
jgi:hypothetical protein